MSRNPPADPPSRYFVSAPVDFLFLGGASLVLYFLCLHYRSWSSSPHLITAAAALVWVCNYPHFASTNYRLYRTRSNVRQYPVTAALVPVLMLGAVIASYASPGAVAPLFIKLYLIWSPYHFSAQTLGLTLVYARRSGFTINQVERKVLAAFIFLTFATASARAEIGSAKSAFYGVSYPALGLHSWVPNLLSKAMWASAIVFGLLMAWRLVRRHELIPWIVPLPAFAQAVWFVHIPGTPVAAAGNFVYLVPFFHSLQYLLIAWGVQMKESQDEAQRAPSGRFVLTETARWAALCFAGGYVLFWLLPKIGNNFGEPAAFSTAVIFAAVQVHHFFVDGVIWKLKNPRVQSPTMTSLRDLAGWTRQEEPVPVPVAA